tara:strand:+ start:4393 stop:5157 length:765 start_codon:yes stop_codon:yes gene_type:complete
MLFAVDIGNTNVTIGVFDKETIVTSFRLNTDTNRFAEEYLLSINSLLSLRDIDANDIDSCVICSVVPPLNPIFTLVSQNLFSLDPLIVGTGIKTGIKILYDNPRDVGSDRITDAVAAFNMYGGPAVVVDCGTATVFDAISQNGEYLGGSIAAGARLSADALFSNTSQLKRVELLAPEHVIGKSTTLSLQSGLVLGNVYMIEGMVKKFAEEMNTNPIIIGTGGLSTLFSNVTDIFDHVNENLTLEGLRIIYNLNM